MMPPWAHACGFADLELPLEDDTAVLIVGRGTVLPIKLSPVMPAILAELTRYGNSIATNGNGGPDEDMHVRLTLAGNAKDNQTVQRLVRGAGLHRRVELSEDRSDLRAENLAVVGDGKAIKDAREVVIRHAAEQARKAGAEVEPYVRNLRDLFDLHDTLHLGATDY